MIRALIVGDRPSPRMKQNAEAFSGARCEPRLLAWLRELGLSRAEIITVNRVNPAFKAYVAEAQERRLPIVALGEAASAALQKLSVDFYKLPHPSGLNRQINNPKNIVVKLSLCRFWLKQQGV